MKKVTSCLKSIKLCEEDYKRCSYSITFPKDSSNFLFWIHLCKSVWKALTAFSNGSEARLYSKNDCNLRTDKSIWDLSGLEKQRKGISGTSTTSATPRRRQLILNTKTVLSQTKQFLTMLSLQINLRKKSLSRCEFANASSESSSPESDISETLGRDGTRILWMLLK